MRKFAVPVLAVSLVLFGCAAAEAPKPGPETLEGRLQAIADGKASSGDMTVIYDDLDGVGGGTVTTVHGDGTVEQRTQKPAQDPPKAHALSKEQMRALVQLLLDLRAWEQKTPDREAMEDESKTALTIRVGALESRVWEWHNDLAANARMVKVIDKIHEYSWQG